jgi:putative membrane protein
MGVANVIPGVSGGTMAVVMGIYDKLIHSVTHIRKEFKESMKFLLPIFLGLVIGIVGLSYLITFLFENLPVQTNFLFIGLIIGGLPMILGKLKETNKKINFGNVIVGILFFAFVVVLAFIHPEETTGVEFVFSFTNITKLFMVGVVASATMVIPGVSGSMVMILMGYYYTIIAAIKDFIEALRIFDINGMITGVKFLIPLALGIVIGIVLIAKIIEAIFIKAPNYAYCAILGLIFASPVAIIVMSDIPRYTIGTSFTGILAAVLGCFIALKLGKE